MRKHIFLILAICALGQALAGEQPPATSSDRISALPLDVIAAASGGYWRSGDHSGIFRVVIRSRGSEHLSTLALIEKIGAAGVVRSTIIEELSDNAMFIVTDVCAMQDNGDAPRFELTIRHRYESRVDRVEIEVMGDGTYKMTSGWPPRS